MLEIRNLTISRGGKTIADGLSLEVGKGTTLIVRGDNGSGKSALLECLVGSLSPAGGQVLIDGHDLHRLGRSEKKLFLQSTGIVLQQTMLRPYDTVRSTLTQGTLEPEKISEMLAFLDLGSAGDTMVQDLSFGQRRQLDLVRSLAHDPSLLIWDEPFMTLDGAQQEKFQSLLMKLKSSGSTLVIATVNPEPFNFLNPEKMLEL